MTTHVSITLSFCIAHTQSLGFEYPTGLGTLWIPRSEIRNLESILAGDPGYHENVEVEIPKWLAERRGLDPYCEELEDEVY